jgi:hypothetical protein
VRWIGFRKGRKPPDERTAPWHEPHGAYTRKTKTALLRCAEPFKWPLLATAQWRRLARAILDTLAIPDAGTGIEAVRRANQTVSSSQPLVVRIFLPYSRQAKWLDARQDVWEIPGEIRGNPLYLNELTAELDWADSLSFRLRKLLAKAVLPLKASRKAKDLDSVWTVSAAKFEDGLERCFRSLLACLPKASETSEARKTWREEARRMCLELVEPTALKSPSAGVLESICQERIFTGQLNKLVKGGLP